MNIQNRLTEARVRSVLQEVRYPGRDRDFVSFGMLRGAWLAKVGR
ncbi:MAG: hypothetical protein WD737_12405 [Gemmatimonadota bacterium]